MFRPRRLGAVAALVVALALTVAAPAGASGHEPFIHHCHWWPGRTEVHWDDGWLLTHHRVNGVEKVVFRWNGFFNVTETNFIPLGTHTNHSWFTTAIGAQTVFATLYLSNGQTVRAPGQEGTFAPCVNGNL